MKKLVVPTILIVIVVILLPFISQLAKKPVPAVAVQDERTLVEGYFKKNGLIRTTGLSALAGEKELMMLTHSDYQLTNLKPDKTKIKDVDYDGFYIEDTDFDYPALVGNCVEVEVQSAIESTASFANYKRFPAKVLSLSSVPREKCNPYTNAPKASGASTSITGTLERMTRPSPDIFYDYILNFDEVVTDTNNASGMTQEVKSYVLVPSSDKTWGDLEDNIGNQVSIDGTFEWGFAESKYVLVSKVTMLEAKSEPPADSETTDSDTEQNDN